MHPNINEFKRKLNLWKNHAAQNIFKCFHCSLGLTLSKDIIIY